MPWPKLTDRARAIAHHGDGERCQLCGRLGVLDASLHLWVECDDRDVPTAALLVCCGACEKREIEPHPRLYQRVANNEPRPGAMVQCAGCRFLEAIPLRRCAHPQLKANGGPGLVLRAPKPIRAFLCGTGLGGLHTLYPKPPVCTGREEPPRVG